MSGVDGFTGTSGGTSGGKPTDLAGAVLIGYAKTANGKLTNARYNLAMDDQALEEMLSVMNQEVTYRDNMIKELGDISDALQASLGDTSDSGKMRTAYLQNELDQEQRSLGAEDVFIGLVKERQQEILDHMDDDHAWIDFWEQTIVDLQAEWRRTHEFGSPIPF